KLAIGSTGALNAAAPTIVEFGAGANATLALSGFSVAVSQLGYSSADPGHPIIENGSAAPATLTYVDDGSQHNFPAVLRDGTGGGALGFTKAGDGQLTLNADNSFTGPLTINQGKVIQAGSLACDVYNFSEFRHNNFESFGGRLYNFGVTTFEFS